LRPLLTACPAWASLNIGLPPNQFFAWAMDGAAVENYFAAPLQDASNIVYAVSGRLLDACNPILATNAMGEMERAKTFNGLSWKGFPFVAPFLKSVTSEQSSFAFGGLGPGSTLTTPMPEALINEVTTHTNLLYYDWEVTAPRILAGIYTTQLGRVMFQKA